MKKEMKLTPEQIQELYKFTRQHYVEHYDVQTELVDHLANDIELIWQEQPTISFNRARDISFKKFGVFGFMDVVEERQKALGKKYWKLIWDFTKDWFKLPKIVLTGCIFMLFYLIFKSEFGEIILFSTIIILCVFGLVKAFHLKKSLKNRIKLTGKKWMLEEMIFSAGMGSFFLIPLNFLHIINLTKFEENITYSNWLAILYSAFFSLMILTTYIGVEVLPKKAEELLIKNYPEYKLVN